MHPTAAWVLGLLAGLIGTWVAALVPIVGVPAVGGAMLLATGLWFAYFQHAQIAILRRDQRDERFLPDG